MALLQNGFKDGNFEERMIDLIVYRMLQLSMFKNYQAVWSDSVSPEIDK